MAAEQSPISVLSKNIKTLFWQFLHTIWYTTYLVFTLYMSLNSS